MNVCLSLIITSITCTAAISHPFRSRLRRLARLLPTASHYTPVPVTGDYEVWIRKSGGREVVTAPPRGRGLGVVLDRSFPQRVEFFDVIRAGLDRETRATTWWNYAVTAVVGTASGPAVAVWRAPDGEPHHLYAFSAGPDNDD